MSIEDLKKKFIVDDDVLKDRLEDIATKALEHCVVDKKGNVHFNSSNLSAREKLSLILAARAIASQMDETIKSDVSMAELTLNSGLPEKQITARIAELTKDKLVTSSKKGIYSAVPHKVEALLNSVKRAEKTS
jgi:hypothetical protein